MRAADRDARQNRADFRELDPASGIGGALGRIETMLREQNALLAANRAAASEYERISAKGLDYEELVAQVIADIAVVHGDRAERSGADAGLRRGEKRLAKRGDVTVWLGDDPAVVVEVKDSARVTATVMQRELSAAMENRGARAGIAVISTNRSSLMWGRPDPPLRTDMWAVHLPKDRPDPLPAPDRISARAPGGPRESSRVRLSGPRRDSLARGGGHAAA